MRTSTGPQPFQLNGVTSLTPIAGLNRRLETILEKATGLHHLNHFYENLPQQVRDDQDSFLRYLFELFHIEYQVTNEELTNIPRQGSAIIVANHPFGAIEGVILAYLLKQIRPDVRIMANYFLQRIPELQDLFIAVDPFGGTKSTKSNIKPLREAVRWLNSGGLLVVFPAGEVSHLQPSKACITDPEWSNNIARMIKLTEAPVLPAYFHGQNSWKFQLLGLIHPRFRTGMIPRELMNKKSSSIKLRIGKLIQYNIISSMHDQAVTDYLRLRTYLLAHEHQRVRSTVSDSTCALFEEISEAVSKDLLVQEINALLSEHRIANAGALEVYYASAQQIPWILQEIGRLRELTFRETGEGTGRSTDIDVYDNYYHHLFLWNPTTQEIVGAYRLGLTDEIVANYGVRGLYTHTLFRYDKQLINKLNPAIELGRSFILSKYQRSYAPLMLLWKGIGQFVAQRPQYRILFGPVSISNDYDTVSRQLLIDYLSTTNFDADLSTLVKPRNPFWSKNLMPGWQRQRNRIIIKDLNAISDLVSQLENDGKGIPILLKQYLKLGGKLLGFNLDRDFNNALDGLIMVDLMHTNKKVLQKHMGHKQAEHFIRFHTKQVSQVS